MVEQSLQRVELGRHVFRETLDVRVVDDFDALLQLAPVVHRRHLQVTFDLLAYFLETLHDVNAGDRVDAIKRFQTQVRLFVLACYLPEIYD